ncbi:MAG: hypothetical protein H6500_01430 [Candidatus Woesearchaeota archaeon]|nr:hypothetical protein [Nanoarchaeota archaeon]USN44491.1 MAG: hypothetical protein H6500_01430 [Candidatus Woesearchaeota archaeon]
MAFQNTKKLLSSLSRFHQYELVLAQYETTLCLPKKEESSALELHSQIEEKIAYIKRIHFFQNLFYALAYFSFVSAFIQGFFFFGPLAMLISKIVSFFGVSVFLILALFLSKILELRYTELTLITSRYIALYMSKGKEKTPKD